jgi:hypothetical protein
MDVSGNLGLFNAERRGIAPMRAEGARANQKAGSAEETPMQKNLRQMKDNLERLRAAASPKRQAASRVGWLRRRLEIMLASLQFATPEQAKAMARELKSIAKELASAAKCLDGGGGTVALGTIRFAAGNVATTGADAAADTANADATADAGAARAAQAAQQAEAEADQAAQQAAAAARTAKNEAAADAPDKREIGGTSGVSGSNASGADDKSLRAQLKEAGRLLKQILALLKPRLTDKESKKNIEAAEKSLAQVERALSPSDGFYDALGIPASVAEPAGGVDISA